jgi:hypothetical protein
LVSTENTALWQISEDMFFVSKVVGTTEEVQVEEVELIQSDWPRDVSYVVSYRWITGIVDSNVTLVTDCVRVFSVRQTFQPVSPTSTMYINWSQVLFTGVRPQVPVAPYEEIRWMDQGRQIRLPRSNQIILD